MCIRDSFQGDDGVQGVVGFVGVQGATGPSGNQGNPGVDFKISRSYATESDRISASGINLPPNGEYGIIAGPTSSSDYGKLYLYSGGSWSFVSDMSSQGIQGLSGPTGVVGVQGHQGDSGLDITGDQGHQGDSGHQGSSGQQGFQGDTGGSQGPQGNQGVQGSTGSVAILNTAGLIYVDSNASETVSLGTGLIITGSQGSRILSLRPNRPELDVNHVYAYSCSDAAGSSILADSGLNTVNMTLAGGEATAYSLSVYRFGMSPWVRSLRDNNASIATTTSLNFTAGVITVEFVMVPFSIPGALAYRYLFSMYDSTNTYTAYIHFYNGGNAYAGVRSVAGLDTFTSVSSGGVTIGRPTHYMMVFDNTEATAANRLKLYVNGILFSTATGTGGSGTALPTLTKLSLGGNITVSTGSPQGYFRDLRISNIARNATYALTSATALLSL